MADFDSVIVHSQPVGSPASAGLTGTVQCSPGFFATGGGFTVSDNTVPFTVAIDQPVVHGGLPVGWQVEVDFASTTAGSLVVFVVCISDSPIR